MLAKGYGLANVEERIPCGTNTNFRLASVTKQFTAMAVMMLAERKKLSLDERLTDFFPEFPAYGNQITLRHLLTHTSGLIDYEDVIPKGHRDSRAGSRRAAPVDAAGQDLLPARDEVSLQQFGLRAAGPDRGSALGQHLRAVPAGEHLPAA